MLAFRLCHVETLQTLPESYPTYRAAHREAQRRNFAVVPIVVRVSSISVDTPKPQTVLQSTQTEETPKPQTVRTSSNPYDDYLSRKGLGR